MSKLINAICDDDFRIKAFSDYCDDVQSNYQKLIMLQTNLLNTINDDPDLDSVNTRSNSRIHDIVSNALAELDISASNMLCFPRGYISAQDYGETILSAMEDTIINGGDGYDTITHELIDAAGNVTDYMNADELINATKENLYSLTALCAANSASTAKEVSDRLQIFNDKIQTIFQNSYSTVSNTASYLRNIISSEEFNPYTYYDQLTVLLKAEELAEDNSTAVAEESDIYKYTGSSPICALNFNGLFTAIGTVINAGIKIVYNLLSTAINLVGKIAGKLFDGLWKVLVDPYDIEDINKKSTSYTISDFRYNSTSHVISNGTASFTMEYFPQVNWNDYIGKWIKYETIFGEVLIRINDITDHDTGFIDAYYDFQFKPKAINPDIVYQEAKAIWPESVDENNVTGCGDSSPTLSDLESFVLSLKQHPDLYITTDVSEKKLLLGFQYAACLHSNFGSLSNIEIISNINETPPVFPAIWFYDPDEFQGHYFPVLAKNIDFVVQASGWDTQNEVFSTNILPIGYGQSYARYVQTIDNWPIPSAASGYCLMWILNRMLRAKDPIGYEFIPYRNNVDSWNAPRFRIRSDEENQKAMKTLATIISVIVFVAFFSLITISLIKKISRARYMSRVAEVGRMDNAMWNGEKLTSKQKKRYIRLQRKLNCSHALNTGLQDLAGLYSSIGDAVSTTKEDSSGVAQVVSLIH